MKMLKAGGATTAPPDHMGAVFVAMLPTIQNVTRYAFRRQRADRRQELIASAIASAFVGFKRLVDRDRTENAHPSVLAWFGVRQVCDGRKVGGHRNSKDALSDYAQRRRNFRVVGLDDKVPRARGVERIVIEDRRASPADIAAFRIDFADWLGHLRPQLRTLALVLAVGNTPSEAAGRFHVSRSRISQLRGELKASWQAFQGEPLAA